MSFFSTLNYSSCNEDWRTEAAALRIRPGDRVLCVTGSGDRPLNLLAQNPGHILAVDANPAQTHLLELKMAALETLTYEPYAEFLGLTGSAANRPGHWQRVRPALSVPAADHWRRNFKMLRRGVLYQGRWETYYRRVSRIVHLFFGRKISRLFELSNLEAQRRYVREEWDTRLWRWLFRASCSPALSRVFFRDPAFFRHVDCGMPVGRYLYDRMLLVLDHTLARDNFMMCLLFQGKLSARQLPPCLDPQQFPVIRSRVGRVEPQTADLLALLDRVPPGSHDAFSLSDVPSYLDQAAFERLLDLVLRAAKRGARVCIRFFLTAQTVPLRFSDTLRRDRALEEDLARHDQAFAYRFLAATVQPAPP